MEGSLLSFLKVEWKVSDTGSAHWASSYSSNTLKHSEYRHATPLVHIILNTSQPVFVLPSLCCTLCRETATTNFLAHLTQRVMWAIVTTERPSVNFSHFNQLLWSHRANLNQTLVEWSLDGPLPKLCSVIPTSNQDGRQAKNRKKGGWNFDCSLLL
jgi:hypothetical protein